MRNNRQIIITNLTQDVLVFNLRDTRDTGEDANVITLAPVASRVAVVQGKHKRLRLRVSKEEGYIELALKVETWKAVPTPGGVPWRVYVLKAFPDMVKVLIIPKRDLSRFLSAIPDCVPLSCVILPGTHNSMAFYGWPMSQCQSLSTPLITQLRSGIRLVDIRLSVIKGCLIAYHGVYPQRESFKSILATLHSFLSISNETVVVSIKQEDFRETSPQVFSLMVRDEIKQSPGGVDMWFLENRIPNLGEVRGRAIMFSRFGGSGYGWDGGHLGVHPSTWPDGEKFGFSWQCKNTTVRTHDWYNIPSFLSIPEKVTLGIQNMIVYTDSEKSPESVLPITYFSAASFPLAFPTVVARGFGWPKWGMGVEGANSRLGRWLLEKLEGRKEEQRIQGWTLVDFYSEPGLVALLVEHNFV